jgi:RNA polymerase sigma factor (sigma-70 family)
LERRASEDPRRWFFHRASEVDVFVSGVVAEVRKGRGADEARGALVSYVADMHRNIATVLCCATRLECCWADDTLPTPLSPVRADAEAAPTAPSTEQRPWEDSTEIRARFQAGTELVEREARALARRMDFSSDTLADLRAFGREGLLVAARSYDPDGGIPEQAWLTVRIRSAMKDGKRRIRGRPRAPAKAIAIAHEPATAPSSPYESVAASELYEQLRTVLDNHEPLVERQLLERHYFGGQSLEQAASELRLPTSTAARLRRRALDSLRRQLRPSDTV